jgi:hypothetical protein
MKNFVICNAKCHPVTSREATHRGGREGVAGGTGLLTLNLRNKWGESLHGRLNPVTRALIIHCTEGCLASGQVGTGMVKTKSFAFTGVQTPNFPGHC